MRLPRPLFLALRTLLYLLLALIFIRGAASFFPAPPQEAAQLPEPTKPEPKDPPQLQAIAALFATDYLTWDSANPNERAARLQPYLAPGLNPQAGWRPGATPTHQTVQGAWVLATTKTGEGRWTATVAARVRLEPTAPDKPAQSRTLYMAVPLALTAQQTPVVSDLPALLPAPPGPSAPANQPEGQAATDDRAPALLQSFFAAYFSGGDTSYFLTPDAKLAGSPQGVTLVEVAKPTLRKTATQLYAETPVTVIETATGASLTLHYTLQLTEKDGRLYIQDLLQKGA